MQNPTNGSKIARRRPRPRLARLAERANKFASMRANRLTQRFIAAALAMFVVAGLSLIPAIRAIKRINVGEIVRERAV